MGGFIAFVVIVGVFAGPVILLKRREARALEPVEVASPLSPGQVLPAAALAAQDAVTRKIKKGAATSSPRTTSNGITTFDVEVPKAGVVSVAVRSSGTGSTVVVTGGDLRPMRDVYLEKAGRASSWITVLSYRISAGYMGLFGVPYNPDKVVRAKNRIAKKLAVPLAAS